MESANNKAYALGIDGGGSGITFQVCDLRSNQPEITFKINGAGNPNYAGVELFIEFLEKGFEKLKGLCELHLISHAYVGIAGVSLYGGTKPKHYQRIHTSISQFLKTFTLDGDVITSYRSILDSNKGIVAIAGTGSTLALINENKIIRLADSIGVGGRDFATSLLSALNHKIISPASLLGSWLLEQSQSNCTIVQKIAPQQIDSDLTRRLSKELWNKSKTDPRIYTELEYFLHFAGARWAHKVATMFQLWGLNPNEETPLALSGSLWHWEKLREVFLVDLMKYAPSISVTFMPEVSQVQGAVKLAKEWSPLAETT